MSGSHVVVVGGGVAGIACADELARAGITVTLLEKEPAIGGWAADYCCKATDQCNRCFVCVADKEREGVRLSDAVTLLTNHQVREVEKNGSGYHLRVENKDEGVEKEVHADAVVLATGFKPFDATRKGELG